VVARGEAVQVRAVRQGGRQAGALEQGRGVVGAGALRHRPEREQLAHHDRDRPAVEHGVVADEVQRDPAVVTPVHLEPHQPM
jgi:hypothetical protein